MKHPRRLRQDTKKYAAKVVAVKAMVAALVTSLGGFPDEATHHLALVLPTRCGVLRVSMHGTDGCDVYSKFGEPERATALVRSNGKWNHHGFDAMMVDEIREELALAWSRVVLPVEGREAGAAAARAWLAADRRRRDVWVAGVEGHMDGVRGKEADPVPAGVDFELHTAYMACYEREFAGWRAKQGPGLASTKPAGAPQRSARTWGKCFCSSRNSAGKCLDSQTMRPWSAPSVDSQPVLRSVSRV